MLNEDNVARDLFREVCNQLPQNFAKIFWRNTGPQTLNPNTCNKIWHTIRRNITMLYNGIAPMFSTTGLKF